MRYLPELQVTCRCCESAITIQNRFDPAQGKVISEPSECPVCGAAIKARPPLDAGIARGLVLTAAGAKAETKRFKTPEEYLARYTLNERDVDELLALAEQVDQKPAVAERVRAAAEKVKGDYRVERERCLARAAERRGGGR